MGQIEHTMFKVTKAFHKHIFITKWLPPHLDVYIYNPNILLVESVDFVKKKIEQNLFSLFIVVS